MSAKKENVSRGPNSGVRLKLRSAMFCKSIALEPDTNDTTLIGVVPSVDVNIAVKAGDEKGPFPIQLPLWCHVLLLIDNPPASPTSEELEIIFKLNKSEFTNKVRLEIQPVFNQASVNVRIATPNGLPLLPGLQTFVMVLKHNGHEVGSADLPILVKIASTNKLG
ncbi:hypothetical protein KBI23_14450 [bacterium]|nr:hypothetical protein [bacterium]